MRLRLQGNVQHEYISGVNNVNHLCSVEMQTKFSPTMYDMSQLFTKRVLVGIIVFQQFVIIYLLWNTNCQHYPTYYPAISGDNYSHKPMKHDGSKDLMYGVMFDAGSTGSRVHIYQFSHNQQGMVKLENEVFKQVKPGLSAYASKPREGAQSLKAMLDEAKLSIPSSKWTTTPIALKATAGLRLLSEISANNLLNEVRALFQEYPFALSGNGIQIMEGTDEGVFSWITLNFLLKKLLHGQKTIGALDMGGGSTQVTYVPESEKSIKAAPQGFTKSISVFNLNYSLYTHSYLGLGLMSARLQIYGGREDKLLDKSPKSDTLYSACLPPLYNGKWTHGNRHYIVRGLPKDKSGYLPCYDLAQKLVSSVDKPKDLKNQKVYLFSYYYDRAVRSGLINDVKGGTVRLENFHQAAVTACGKPDLNEPHLCTDLTYIYTILHHGYGFEKDTELVLAKKINGVELGWALGATFQIIPHKAPS